jgi:hypothetical protein
MSRHGLMILFYELTEVPFYVGWKMAIRRNNQCPTFSLIGAGNSSHGTRLVAGGGWAKRMGRFSVGWRP